MVLYVAALEMRTTFCQMYLFNYASQKHETSLILNGKEWGLGNIEKEKGCEVECG